MERQPPLNILNVEAKDWDNYTPTDLFVNFLPYLIYDVVDLRNHFERQYETLSKLYISHSQSYAKWINDDLQQNLSEAITIFVKDCIRRLFDSNNKTKLDMGL